MSAPTGTPEEIAAAEAAAAETARLAAEAAAGGGDDELDPEARAALGDKGQQAIDRMKAEKKELREQLAKFKGLGLDPDALRALIGKSETDAAAAAAAIQRSEAESAALGKANERLVKAEVKAAAAGKLANPALALRLLDLSSFDVDDDGEVDSAAITAAIDELITKEPYLAVVQGDPPRRFQGGADGGARGSAGKPQVTEQELANMTPEQIVAAQNEGRLVKLLGG